MVPLHSPEVSETVRTGRNIDLSAELSETRAISTDISKYFYKRNNNKKKIIISNWTYFSYADWPVSSLCKQKCSSVSHWFGIILTIHMSKHASLSF